MEGKQAREMRGTHSTLTHHLPFLALPYPAREVGVLKRDGMGEGERELGADLGAKALSSHSMFDQRPWFQKAKIILYH
jgi:hypothetical protein